METTAVRRRRRRQRLKLNGKTSKYRMTAQDDVNIIEKEFKGTAKLSDDIRVHTSWGVHTHTHAREAPSSRK